MYIEKYFENLKKVLLTVEQTQKETIEKVAKVVAERLVDGGAWHIQDSGHMLMYELIDRAGLKGFSIGCVTVSKKHGNFITTKPRATANDVYTLIQIVKDKIKSESFVNKDINT